MKITIWERQDRKDFVCEYGPGDYKHNHIEDGWCKNDFPTPINKFQKDEWDHSNWRKTFGHLIDGKVIKS